jgi:hypothetical protein
MHTSNERRDLYIFPNLGLLVKWPPCFYTSEVKKRKTIQNYLRNSWKAVDKAEGDGETIRIDDVKERIVVLRKQCNWLRILPDNRY